MPRRFDDLLTPDQLRPALASGESVADIAERVGCSAQTVYNHLVKHGLKAPPPVASSPAGADLRAVYKSGSVATVAARFGVSRSQAHRWLQAAGIVGHPTKPGAPPRDFDVADAAQRYAEGASLAVLADDHGVSVNTLSRRLKEHGVVLRARGPKARL